MPKGINENHLQQQIGNIALLEDFNHKESSYESRSQKFQADEEDLARNEGHIIRSDN